MKNNIPYAAQLETALQAKDQEKVDKIMQDADMFALEIDRKIRERQEHKIGGKIDDAD